MDMMDTEILGQDISSETVAPTVHVSTNATDPSLGHYTNARGSVIPVMAKDDYDGILQALKTNGCCIIKKLIPPEMCEAVIEEGWDFLNRHAHIFEHDVQTFSRMNAPTHGFAELYGMPSMFRIRVYEPLLRVWQHILGTRSIWVGVDRLGWKPPFKEEKADGTVKYYPELTRQNLVHTDVNLWHLPPIDVYQGLVALRDTAVDQGGFGCITGFDVWEHRRRNQYRAAPESKRFVPLPEQEEMGKLLLIPPFEQGDFVIWHSATPHCGTGNVSNKWRYALYARYFPALPEDAHQPKNTRECLLHGKRPVNHPLGNTTPAWNKTWEEGMHDNLEFIKGLNEEQLAVLGMRDWEAVNPHHRDELAAMYDRPHLCVEPTARRHQTRPTSSSSTSSASTTSTSATTDARPKKKNRLQSASATGKR